LVESRNLDVVMASQAFNLFEFLDGLDIWDKFSVSYNPGDEPGKEFYNFTGSVRERTENQMTINYNYHDEWYFGHNMCYGVMVLEPKTKTVLCYSLKDKYDNYFTPSPITIFGAFNNAEKQDELAWSAITTEEPSNEKYDKAEWMIDSEFPWTEQDVIFECGGGA